MEPRPRPAGRNAAPPAAGAASRSNEKAGKRSMLLDSFKKSFRRPNFPDLILGSQGKLFSRLRGLKTAATNTLDVTKDVAQIKSLLVPSLLASRNPSPSHPQRLDTRAETATEEQMHSASFTASQKRKQPQEHGDAPSRAKSKPRPMVENPEKRHNVQEWLSTHSGEVSPTTITLLPGTEDTRRCDSPVTLPVTDANFDDTVSASSSYALTTVAGSSREILESLIHRGSIAKHQSEPQGATSSSQLPMTDERRDSTATSTNLTYRDSLFSISHSVGTSPSETSLPLTTTRRVKAESRSSSFFSRPSPRSSIASSAPAPPFALPRTLSANSAGYFEGLNELAEHPLPNAPHMSPLRSHPTFLGDLDNVQNAVNIDQIVKTGHIAQERRANPNPVNEMSLPPHNKAALGFLAAANATATTDLTPITETASDDGFSSGRKPQLHGSDSTQTEKAYISDTDEKETPIGDAADPSSPSTPESTDQLSEIIVTGDRISENLTPATTITGVPDMSERDLVLPLSDESDDSLSDITDYTDDSLFEAVEAFGPGLSNPLMLSIIMTFKDDVLRLVLARVNLMLGDSNGVTQHNNDGASGPSGGGSSTNDPARNQNTTIQPNGTRKRALDDERDRSREDDGDDRGKRTKPTVDIASDLQMRYRRLACPFFKRYTGTKWTGACVKPGFGTVHRMKEHVYRKHDHPYCQRCHVTFAEQKALEEHAQADTPCTVRKGRLGHKGITPEQRTLLKSRKKQNAKATEEEKWADIYSLLFPEEEEIPSPYYDLKTCEELINPATAVAFREFLAKDIPTRVTRELEEATLPIPGAQSDFVQAQLPDIIRSCILVAFDNLPSQLLARDEAAPSPTTRVDAAASTANSPDSHNTAQIGSQFPSIEPPRELINSHQDGTTEIMLPDNLQPWVQAHEYQDWNFGEGSFSNPLAQNAEGFMASNLNSQQSFHAGMDGLTTIEFPSVTPSGIPAPSPTFQEMLSGRVDFGDGGAGPGVFQGNLANMPNATFLFTPDAKPSVNWYGARPQPHRDTYETSR